MGYTPHPKQEQFLLHTTTRELFYGGAGGGGKSQAAWFGALQYVDVPGYAALIFRRTYADLSLPSALMARSKQYLANTAAHWCESVKTWAFPSGATITFAYLENENDKYRYSSAEFQYIFFDELTQFTETQFTFLFTRLRKPRDGPLADVPLRMRSASNPGGPGHEWVKRRYVDSETRDRKRVFIPARIDDNPSLDEESYRESLANTDPTTRAQIESGDWDAVAGTFFKGLEKVKIVGAAPAPDQFTRVVRYWDLAATEDQAGTDPDYTAGVKIGKHKDGSFWVLSVIRERLGPKGVRNLIKQTAELDGRGVVVRLEREGGASGKIVAYNIVAEELAGWAAAGVKPKGSKAERAEPWGSQIEAGNVYIVKDRNTNAFIDEHRAFTGGGETHDDMVDAASGAFSECNLPGVAWAIATG